MNVKHLYTSWEENPAERIERSKHRSALFPSLSSPTRTGGEIDGTLKPEQDSAFTESSDESQKIPEIPKESAADSTEAIAIPKEEDPSNHTIPVPQPNGIAVEKSTQTEANAELNKTERLSSNPPPPPAFKPRSRFSGRPFVPFIPRFAAARAAYAQRYSTDVRPAPRFSSATKAKVVKSPKSLKQMYEQVSTNSTPAPSAKTASIPADSIVSNDKQTTQERSLSQDRETSSLPESKKQGDFTAEGQTASCGRSKYSLEELVAIQERVRASLQRQGVVSLSSI